MPRKKYPNNPLNPYHVSARCLNREWFPLPIELTWSIMEDYLYLIAAQFNVRIHSFVLMSNHFHLIISAPHNNLSQALLYFMRETSKEIGRLSGRINQVYGARNFKTHLGSFHYFMNTYKYVYRNPVRAGICQFVEEYPYSTLHGQCGLKKLIIPLAEDTLLFDPNFSESALRWLNATPNIELEDEMRLILRRSNFESKAPKRTGRLSLLETQLL